MNIQEKLNWYCENEMYQLKKICYPMIIKIGGISDKDYDDFYSIALSVLADTALRYDDSNICDFDSFLASNIKRKFKTEIRDRNRAKRIPSKQMSSINDLVGEDGRPLSEKIPSNFDIYEEACGEHFEGTNVEQYMNRLSELQKTIVKMLYIGYSAKDIQNKLHISKKEYDNNYAAITCYENKRILTRKTYKKHVM